EAANMTKCRNNLKQIGLAAQNCHDTAGRLPPAQGWFPSKKPHSSSGWGTHFFHTLAYIEQGSVYNNASASGPNPMGENPGIYWSSAFGVDTLQFVGLQPIK